MRLLFSVLLVVSWSCCVRPQGITVEGVQCGVRKCQLNEYCSDVDRTCQTCDEVCNSGHHNYERPICERQCQDYLHDLRYARKSGNGGNGNNEELEATVAKLSRMVTVNLTLVCLMLIALVTFLSFQLYRWKDKKNVTLASLRAKLFGKRQTADSGTPKGNKGLSNNETKKPDLRLEMPTSGSNSDHSPVTITTSISRRPAEDSTLDYSYDNPAMSPPR